MKHTSLTSSAVMQITISMALLAVLSAIKSPAVHAVPVSNAGTPLVNVILQTDSEAPTQGSRRSSRPLLSGGVKGTSSLGKTHPSAVEKSEPSVGKVSMRPGHATKRERNEELWDQIGKACKRGDGKDEAPESIWKWNEKGRAANDAVAAGGGDGGLGRFKVIHQGYGGVVMVRNGISERPVKPEQKKRNVDDWKKEVDGLETLEKSKFCTKNFKREEEGGEAETEAEARIEGMEGERGVEREKLRCKKRDN
ncbi:hypothetical protein K457DRAFT_23817 [Linnemannia elongata AG-77]|uniref:Uncharacterized protein n=1 Tax=Linnemannia elongata AG-77 TaxID=1314771 RepID=A0A197JJJ8_9FUNG|nr:hypothetical protein K457DRAFT_23817 [Linnemannia elongata AG-77]